MTEPGERLTLDAAYTHLKGTIQHMQEAVLVLPDQTVLAVRLHSASSLEPSPWSTETPRLDFTGDVRAAYAPPHPPARPGIEEVTCLPET